MVKHLEEERQQYHLHSKGAKTSSAFGIEDGTAFAEEAWSKED